LIDIFYSKILGSTSKNITQRRSFPSPWFSVKQSRVQYPVSAGQWQSLITQSYTEKTQSCTEKKFYHFVVLRETIARQTIAPAYRCFPTVGYPFGICCYL